MTSQKIDRRVSSLHEFLKKTPEEKLPRLAFAFLIVPLLSGSISSLELEVLFVQLNTQRKIEA